MKTLLLIIIFATVTKAYNPCFDSLYIELQQKPITQMTDREYEYFLEKERLCVDMDREYEKRETKTSIILLQISGIILAGTLIFMAFR